MKKIEKALVLFSGGKDSLVLTLRLLDSGCKVYLVTFENGYGLKAQNVNSTIKRLMKKYSHDKIEKLGIKNVSGLFREFMYPFYNYTSSFINNRFGDISISQFNCLSCRLSMYITSIILSQQYNINYVFDGARKVQTFAIEQSEMIKKFKDLFGTYNIDIEYPLENEIEDWKIQNELLLRGIVPKTLEPKCLLGVPLKKLDDDVLKGTINVYENYLKPKAIDLIQKYKDLKFNGELI